MGEFLINIADVVCGYPLFALLIGGGVLLFLYSGGVSIRRLPEALRLLREKNDGSGSERGRITSVEALASVVAATVGMGNIAGVAIALVMGGPGAIFWMWVSAIVGMATKYHEGVLAVKYRGKDADGNDQGGPMHYVSRGLSRRWRWLSTWFATAGMFGTLCIMNANQLTETMVTTIGAGDSVAMRFWIGLVIAGVVSAVVLGGLKRIAKVATLLVPFMVGLYFIIVGCIIVTNLESVPGVIMSIFSEAFNLRAGFGALAGMALIGARRAMLVNDAGVGTASLMHGSSSNQEPVKEGLMAMLGPAIDSGLVCTLTAIAILLGTDLGSVEEMKGLSVAMGAFGSLLPYGDMLLTCIVVCFALSSMFSYSFYGQSCCRYLFGSKVSKFYLLFFIGTLVVFAVIPVGAAVGLCDFFYAMMAFPTMAALLRLSPKVKEETRRYFGRKEEKMLA